MERVGISVRGSDFSILQAFCKEIQPGNLLAKYLKQFHEAPANIQCKKKKKKKNNPVMVRPYIIPKYVEAEV